jgi:hypothetical protein
MALRRLAIRSMRSGATRGLTHASLLDAASNFRIDLRSFVNEMILVVSIGRSGEKISDI